MCQQIFVKLMKSYLIDTLCIICSRELATEITTFHIIYMYLTILYHKLENIECSFNSNDIDILRASKLSVDLCTNTFTKSIKSFIELFVYIVN